MIIITPALLSTKVPAMAPGYLQSSQDTQKPSTETQRYGGNPGLRYTITLEHSRECGCIQRKYPWNVLSNIGRKKAICHFLYSKTLGIGRKKYKLGQGGGRVGRGLKPETAWPSAPSGPSAISASEATSAEFTKYLPSAPNSLTVTLN